MAGIGIAACLEPSGGNSSFEPLLNEANKTSTWMESCQVNIDALGMVIARIHTTSSGQGHETLVSTILGEVLEIEPSDIRVARPNSLESRLVIHRLAVAWRSCWVARRHAGERLKTKLIAIAALRTRRCR